VKSSVFPIRRMPMIAAKEIIVSMSFAANFLPE